MGSLLGQMLMFELATFFLSFGVSVILGVGAISGALLRIRKEALLFAWICIVTSLGAAFMFLCLHGLNLRPEAYAVTACPSILGFAALKLNRLYANMEPFQGDPFTLPAILLTTAAVVFVLGILTIVWCA